MGHVLSQLLRSFGIAAAAVPDDVDAKAAMYRSWLTGRRVLIVIDDAASPSRAELLLPGNPDCAVLVTARGAMTGLAASHSFEVGPLDERSAGWLLADALGASRIDAEPEAARAVARLCDGLPLALRGAAARLAARPHWPVRALARRLADEGFRLDLLGGDNDGIRMTLAVSCANLSQAGRRLLCGLSRLGSADFTPRSCGLLLNCGVDAAEDLLEDLVAARLMVPRIAADGTVRFRLHDLVRIYAAEWPAGQEDLGCGEHGGPPAVAGHREAASPAGIPVLPTGRIAMAGEA